MTTDQINKLCFRYEYDSRHRMIAKKVPGAGWVYSAFHSVVFEGEFTNEDTPSLPDGTIFTAQIDAAIPIIDNGQQTISQYPASSGTTLIPLTYIFYDDDSNTSCSYDPSNGSKLDLDPANETPFSYASEKIKGMVTSAK